MLEDARVIASWQRIRNKRSCAEVCCYTLGIYCRCGINRSGQSGERNTFVNAIDPNAQRFRIHVETETNYGAVWNWSGNPTRILPGAA